MRKHDYDSQLLISRSRQTSLILLIIIMTIGITVWIMQGEERNLTWWKIGVPICAVSCIFLLLPPTEEWEYKAWQAKPRKVEQHFDR